MKDPAYSPARARLVTLAVFAAIGVMSMALLHATSTTPGLHALAWVGVAVLIGFGLALLRAAWDDD